MEQITIKHLERAVARLNTITGNKFDFSIGSGYNGKHKGVKLESHKGSRDTLLCGYSTKDELYMLIHSYINGFELAESMFKNAISELIKD